jgi:signal peptidase I
MTTLLLYGSILAASLLLHAGFLWIGARWTKAAKPTIIRALVGSLLMFLVGILLLVMFGWTQRPVKQDYFALDFMISVGLLLWEVLVSWLIIKGVFLTTIWRAALIWLLSLVPSFSALAFVFLVVRPYVLEAFVIPAHSMAPTLVGWHKTGTCPHCGQSVFIPAVPPEERMTSGPSGFIPLGICTHCFRSSNHEDVSSDSLPPDRIIANKLLSPRRWDVIVFRFPQNPSLQYAMRLVGMPGEQVFLKDGAIWVNGIKLTPPESIADLKYSTDFEDAQSAPMGSPDQPWNLQEDEFCVLGDFTSRSNDSRYWGPVPRSNIEGVVTIRYWPISRWQVWR